MLQYIKIQSIFVPFYTDILIQFCEQSKFAYKMFTLFLWISMIIYLKKSTVWVRYLFRIIIYYIKYIKPHLQKKINLCKALFPQLDTAVFSCQNSSWLFMFLSFFIRTDMNLSLFGEVKTFSVWSTCCRRVYWRQCS